MLVPIGPPTWDCTARSSAPAGFFLFVFAVSWVFGREFSDGTVKDLLAVPVARASNYPRKFWVVAVWSVVLSVVIYLAGLVMGVVIGLPGWIASAVVLHAQATSLVA